MSTTGQANMFNVKYNVSFFASHLDTFGSYIELDKYVVSIVNIQEQLPYEQRINNGTIIDVLIELKDATSEWKSRMNTHDYKKMFDVIVECFKYLCSNRVFRKYDCPTVIAESIVCYYHVFKGLPLSGVSEKSTPDLGPNGFGVRCCCNDGGSYVTLDESVMTIVRAQENLPEKNRISLYNIAHSIVQLKYHARISGIDFCILLECLEYFCVNHAFTQISSWNIIWDSVVSCHTIFEECFRVIVDKNEVVDNRLLFAIPHNGYYVVVPRFAAYDYDIAYAIERTKMSKVKSARSA